MECPAVKEAQAASVVLVVKAKVKAVVKAVSAVPQVKVAQALTAVPDAPAHP